MRMSLTEVTNEFVLPLWDQKALNVIDSFVAPNADIQTTLLSGQGPKALKHHVQHIFNAFKEFKFKIENMVSFNNQYIYKWQGKAAYQDTSPTHSFPLDIVFSGMFSITLEKKSIIRYESFSDIPKIIQPKATIEEESPINMLDFEKEHVIVALRNLSGRSLTKREVECLSLWLKGFSMKESAKYMGNLSTRTIQTFRENIKRKLHVETYQNLFGLVQQSGLMALLTNR